MHKHSPDVGFFSLIIVILAVAYIMWRPPAVIASASVSYDGQVIIGKVVDTRGDPVVGAAVSFVPPSQKELVPFQSLIAATTTDEEGNFVIEAVPVPEPVNQTTEAEPATKEEPVNLLIRSGLQDEVALKISELESVEVTVRHNRSSVFPIPLLVY